MFNKTQLHTTHKTIKMYIFMYLLWTSYTQYI